RFERVVALVREIIADGSTVVVATHVDAIARMLQTEIGPRATYLNGRACAAATRTLDAFDRGEVRVLVVLVLHAYAGLHRQRASHLVIADPWPDEAENRQLVGRLNRLGQTATRIHVHRVWTDLPIDLHFRAPGASMTDLSSLVSELVGARARP